MAKSSFCTPHQNLFLSSNEASDPLLLEKQELKQPGALALSYVLRISTADTNIKHEDISMLDHRPMTPESLRSITPVGSEFDDDGDDLMSSDDEDSDDSVVHGKEELTSQYILRMKNGKEGAGSEDRPFVCPVQGCTKRYKNINGIKYHAKNGHKSSIRIQNIYRCHCGKNYKTAHGLRNHNLTQHSAIQLCSHGNSNRIITSHTVLVKHFSKQSQSLKHFTKPSQSIKPGKSILMTPINQDLLVDNLQRFELPSVTTDIEEDFL